MGRGSLPQCSMARGALEGVAPDLDRHCERVNRSAVNFKLKPVVDAETWLALAREGIARFGEKAELYIRPMYWAQTGAERHVPQRHHAAAGDRPVAGRRRHRCRDDTQISGFSWCRRNLLQRQFCQGRAGDPDRRPFIAAGPVLSARTQALLGIRARLSALRLCSSFRDG